MNTKAYYFTFLLALCIGQVAPAQNWELKSTTPYGTGGHWENGQKIRIDASYRGGVFQFERKESAGTNMSVYSTRADFSKPASSYAPGEDLSIRISFTEKGARNGYVPYARVTLLREHPGSAPDITASSSLSGQASDAAGRSVVSPPETVTLMATAPTSGSQMALVYSCNGMDVVYLYEREDVAGTAGAPGTQQEEVREDMTEPAMAGPDEEEEEVVDQTAYWGDDLSSESDFPLVKLLVVSGVALALIALILLLFRKKNPKAPVCPSCGAPIDADARFCENCGHKLH